MYLGLERREVRMTKSQFDQVVSQLLADTDFVDFMRVQVAILDAYIDSLQPDIAEDLKKRPYPEHLQRIKKEIIEVTGDKNASVFSSKISQKVINLIRGRIL